MANKASWIAGGVLAAFGLILGFGQMINSDFGISNIAFVTQTSPSVLGNGFVDLSLKKELVSIAAGNKYIYKITISNNGTMTATNFSVKDYLPSNSSVFTVSNGGVNNQGVVTRNVSSLAAGQNAVVTIVLKRNNQNYFINKAEVCAYEDANSPGIDADSDPCSMGTVGYPHQDDEGAVWFATGSTGGNIVTGGQNTGFSGGIGDNPNPNGSSNAGSGSQGVDIQDFVCTPRVSIVSSQAPGLFTFQVLPSPLPLGYGLSQSACVLIELTYEGIPTGITYPLQTDTNGYGSLGNLSAGQYGVSCDVTTPSGNVLHCRNQYFYINGGGSGEVSSGGYKSEK